MNSLRIAIGMTGALLAAGCAAMAFYGLEPGRSTEGDVRRALGEPASVFAAADGSRSLVFPQGPLGTQTYVASLGRDGRLANLEQVLSEESFGRIVPGRTTGRDVERLIGPPWRSIEFPNKRQVAWDYRFRDAWGYLAEFSVMLDERGIRGRNRHRSADARHGRQGLARVSAGSGTAQMIFE